MHASIADMLRANALADEHGSALVSLGRRPLTHRDLLDSALTVAARLRGLGVASDDRVALVLPPGPQAAVMFLSAASAATCAPLNPAFTSREYEFHLSDLGAKAVVVAAGISAPVVSTAGRMKIPVVELSESIDEKTGAFELSGLPKPDPSPIHPRPEDVALVLPTSGTTSSPKLVPLTHANLMASVLNIGRTLSLGASDRCLNVLPMFHVHGLVVALLAPLAAGGSVACSTGLETDSFLELTLELEPTWYTAVPAIHEAILRQLRRDRRIPTPLPFRFARSAASPLPPPLMRELEEALGAPVVEAYGMTESACDMIAANPLPPGLRKPGTVGISSGPEVAILDEHGREVPDGRPGEIVIRGPSVMEGYVANGPVGDSAFIGDWFRTGDVGVFDQDRYLTIVGRVKEMINRGGEKIAPQEVDEVIREHEAVAEAVSFAVPHPSLGEDVVAAVVLRRDGRATEDELRAFAAERLAPFKVPRSIAIVDEIPKGPTGKTQRVGLADKLNIGSGRAPRHVAPKDRLEGRLAGIWGQLLGHDGPVGVQDNFFDLGGHSLLLAHMLVEVERETGHRVSLRRFLDEPTIEHLGDQIRRRIRDDVQPLVTTLSPLGFKTPLVAVGAWDWNGAAYRHFVPALRGDRPLYLLGGLQSKDWVRFRSIRQIARTFIGSLKEICPEGPYVICGGSFAGLVAYEMAHQLGEEVELLVLIDTPWKNGLPGYRRWMAGRRINFLRRFIFGGTLRGQHDDRLWWEAAITRWRSRSRMKSLSAPVAFIRSRTTVVETGHPTLGWGTIPSNDVRYYDFSADHGELFRPPAVHDVASIVAEVIR